MARTKTPSTTSATAFLRHSLKPASVFAFKVAKMRSRPHPPKVLRRARSEDLSCEEAEVEFTSVPPRPPPLPRRVFSESELEERELLKPVFGGALCLMCYHDVLQLEDRSSRYCARHQPL